MPDAVELLVLCIHAGCSPTQAVAEVAARAPPAVRPLFADGRAAAAPRPTLADALDALADGGGVGRARRCRGHRRRRP